MFTMALAARVVTDWAGRPGPGRGVRRAVHPSGAGARRRPGRPARGHRQGRRQARRRHGSGSTSSRRTPGPRCSAGPRQSSHWADAGAASTASVPLAGLTTLRLGGPARRLVVAETDDEVVEAVRAADAGGEPLLVLGGGSNLVVADEGFDGTVLQVATRGVAVGAAGRARAAGRGRRRLGPRRGAHGRRGVRRARGALRHPRPGRRRPDPERRRLRPGGRPDRRLGPGPGPQHPRRRPAGPGGVRLRLPRQRVQAVRPLRRAGRGVRPRALPAGRTGPLRRAGPPPRGRGRRPGAGDRRTGCRARAAPRQGHGPGRRRPRHLERRLVLHQPAAPRRPGGRPAGGRAALADRRRPGQDLGRLADRAGRLRQGLRLRRGPGLDQAHAGPDQPRRRHHRRTCWRWPARSGRPCSDRFGVTLVPEPVLVGVEL